MNRIARAFLAMTLAASAASAQDAMVFFEASTLSAAPGDSVTVFVKSSYDLAGAGNGVFGTAGLWGFGGDVLATGTGIAEAVPVGLSPNGNLSVGATNGTINATSLLQIGGSTGSSPAMAGNPVTLYSFTLDVDSDATTSEITYNFEGAVILSLGGTLTTFSTDPGVNQATLTTLPLTISIRNCTADLNNDGFIDSGDITAFINYFLSSNPIADMNNDGFIDSGDISTFIDFFLAGC